MMRKKLVLLLSLLLCLSSAQSAIKVHTIGDSTMAEYDENTTDKRGWAMYLGSFFDANNVTVNNRGKSGSDTRSFYTGAAYWPSVKSQMSAGDYLIIQFAHNDEGNDSELSGLDNLEYAAYCEAKGLPAPTDARGTNPKTTYREILGKFIDEARALGVNPILVAPICRAYFSGGNIKRNGQHDLGDKFAKIENGELLKNQSVPANDLSMSYVEAMRIVAKDKNVPFINMTEGTRQIYTAYGETQCLDLLFCSGDKTHTNALGGNLIARATADSLKKAGILAEYISIPTSISANPASISIGETYSGVAQNKEFLLTGFGLDPENGTVTVSAAGELTVSTDKSNFAQSVNVAYSGGSLFQKVYVRVTYSSAGEQNDAITISSGSTTIQVPVTAKVISLAGGSDVSALWAIDTKPVPAAIVTGPISATFSMSNMMAADMKEDFVYSGDATKVGMVRFHNSDATNGKVAWPAGEIDENATRYMDFAVTAPTTMDVHVTNISMDIAAHSTAVMCCHINTGFGDEFTDVKTIFERKNLPSNTSTDPATILQVALTPTLTIPAGKTLHVRILPWHNLGEAKSGKYICVSNVKIEGKAFDPAMGMEGIQSTEYRIQKFLRDGQLYILRDGKIYNATGAIIK